MHFDFNSLIDSDCPDCGGKGKIEEELCRCVLEAYQREKEEYHLTLS
jgi:DnaJ-class molecular chaperone